MAWFSSQLARVMSPLVSFSRWFTRKQVTILYLHGITAPEARWQPLRHTTSVEVLRKNLALLARHYNFVSLARAIAILRGESSPVENALVITLDDGYHNQLALALPEFRRFDIVPAIYVATAHTASNRPFWFDRLDYALQQITRPAYEVQLGNEKFGFDCASRHRLAESYRSFRHKVKAHFERDDEMRRYLDDLAEQIEKETGKALADIMDTDPQCRLASWPQLIDAVGAGQIEVGNHTVHHARLANLPAESARREINDARLELAFHLPDPSPSFCFPDNSYHHQTGTLVAESGYICALTTNPGLNGLHCDLMSLRRFHFPHQLQPEKALFAVSALRSWIDTLRP